MVIPFAITASMLAAAPAALAGSCYSRTAHTITLSLGKVTPSSGTTTTLFTFSVKYSDSAGCVPSQGSVTVTVAGVGTFAMTATTPGNYFAGVIYTRGVRLPVGTHAYS
ncbi:MAG: hypothetical protein M3O78_06770, partial [Chloroflexota bacterium]|nr:hypothetical protein [Chloroflexota bacterium]